MAVSKVANRSYMPLAAMLATDEIYQAFLGEYRDWKTFFHGHSYTGNPLGCAVALANLQVFRQEHTLTRLQLKIKALSRLLKLLAEHPHVSDIRQCGFMVGIELVKRRMARASPTSRRARGTSSGNRRKKSRSFAETDRQCVCPHAAVSDIDQRTQRHD
jgi:adenosylmethionine-8-amino-7-oxononanoate aminotransferase